MIKQTQYERAKNQAISFFNKNRKIKSLCFGKVCLNSHGFYHLIWRDEGRRQKRDMNSQVKRFHLLPYIKPVLEGMKYYQEYSENIENVRIKKKKKAVIESKMVRYWAFVAVIDNKIRIKIILRKVGDGNIHFWSVIPIWKTEQYKNIKFVLLHKGDLSQD